MGSNLKEMVNCKNNTNGIYYIETTVNEYRSSIQGYFKTLDDAMFALQKCCNWYRPYGTGQIYYQPFGLNVNPILVFENN